MYEICDFPFSPSYLERSSLVVTGILCNYCLAIFFILPILFKLDYNISRLYAMLELNLH